MACNYGRGIRLVEIDLREPAENALTRIRSLLAKLDNDSYAVREAASRELMAIGFIAEAELRRAMKESSSAEVRIRARRLRDALLSQPKATLEGHTDQVEGLAFSPDGKLLASGSKDGSVRLWDVAGRKEKARLVPFRSSR